MAIPSENPIIIATNDVDLPNFTGVPNKVTVRTSVVDSGYGYEQFIPANELNKILNNFGLWLDYLKDFDSATFLDLTDTPNDYTGQANKLVSVNGAEDGLEFIDNNYIELDSNLNSRSQGSLANISFFIDNTTTGSNKNLRTTTRYALSSLGTSESASSEFIFFFNVPSSSTIAANDPLAQISLNGYSLNTNFDNGTAFLWFPLVDGNTGNTVINTYFDVANDRLKAGSGTTLSAGDYYIKGSFPATYT